MQETNITKKIMIALSRIAGVRIFRNNTGMGWTGDAKIGPTRVVIDAPRPLHAGLCKGSSDLIGWTTVDITPDMVGKRVAIFTAVEVKAARGRTSPEQENFIRTVREAGGFAGVARDEHEALNVIRSS